MCVTFGHFDLLVLRSYILQVQSVYTGFIMQLLDIKEILSTLYRMQNQNGRKTWYKKLCKRKLKIIPIIYISR